MILSDKSIRRMLRDGQLIIDPPPADYQIQPASVDVTLDDSFLGPYHSDPVYQDSYMLSPGECVLASTLEWVSIPDIVVGRVEGKSSWGRKFLQVHSTAGFIDPGFKGTITLELTNLTDRALPVSAGTMIAQLSFQWVDEPVERPYGSKGLGNHYQGQHGVTPSALS